MTGQLSYTLEEAQIEAFERDEILHQPIPRD